MSVHPNAHRTGAQLVVDLFDLVLVVPRTRHESLDVLIGICEVNQLLVAEFVFDVSNGLLEGTHGVVVSWSWLGLVDEQLVYSSVFAYWVLLVDAGEFELLVHSFVLDVHLRPLMGCLQTMVFGLFDKTTVLIRVRPILVEMLQVLLDCSCNFIIAWSGLGTFLVFVHDRLSMRNLGLLGELATLFKVLGPVANHVILCRRLPLGELEVVINEVISVLLLANAVWMVSDLIVGRPLA